MEIGPSANSLLIKSLVYISHHNSSERTKINSKGQKVYQREERLGRWIRLSESQVRELFRGGGHCCKALLEQMHLWRNGLQKDLGRTCSA